MPDAAVAPLLSVFYHAYATAHPDAPQIDTLPLDEAAHRLKVDATSPAGESRRRRSIARLSAAAFATQSHQSALQILDAPNAAIGAALASHPGFDEAARETLVNNLLEDLLGPAFPGCERKDLHTAVEPDPDGGTRAIVTLSVLRNIPRLALTMDPQNWARCSSFFPNTYVARRVGTKYPVSPITYDAGREPRPPDPGTTWSAVLFEHFEFDWGLGVSWFRNLLDIEARREGAAHSVAYRLKSSIRSRVALDERPGGIVRDEGKTVATANASGWTALKAIKVIRFSDRPGFPGDIADLWAQVLLPAMGGSVAEGVCCIP